MKIEMHNCQRCDHYGRECKGMRNAERANECGAASYRDERSAPDIANEDLQIAASDAAA